MNFDNVATDVAAQHLEMDVLLRFKLTNPLDVPLIIPGHQVKLQLDGQDVAALTQETNTQLVVPGQGNASQVYRFHFDLGGNDFHQYLGRDVPYTLVARVRPVSFANLTLEFDHSDLPSAAAAAGPHADSERTGECWPCSGGNATDTIDLTPIRNGMGAFVDGLMNPPGGLLVKKALEEVVGAIGGEKWEE
jgi:hypothetical protein